MLDAAAGPIDVEQVWAAVGQAAGPRTAVASAVATVAELVPDPDAWEAGNRQAIAARYRVVRPFVRLLAEQLPLGAAPTGGSETTGRGGPEHWSWCRRCGGGRC